MSSIAEKSKMSTAEKVKWIIALVIIAVFMLIPEGAIYTTNVKYFFMVTVLCIFLMATELIPPALAATAIPIGYWLLSVAPASTVFSPWAAQTPWLVLGSLLLTRVMDKTGLNKRIAYGLMKLGRGKFYVVMFLMVIAGCILACVVPAGIARMVVFCSIGMSLIQAMGWQAGSRESVTAFGLIILAGSGFGYTVMTGANSSFVIAELMEGAGYPITWGQWAFYNVVPSAIQLTIMFFLTIFIFRKLPSSETGTNRTSKEVHAYITEEYSKLGKPSGQELKALVIFIILLVLLVTGEYQPLNAGKSLMLLALVCYLPGVNLLNGDDLKKINWSAVFLVASCLSIGEVATNLGLGDVLVESVLPYLPTSIIALSAVAFFICFFGNMLMTPTAIGSALGMPLITIAEATGINVHGFMMTFWTSAGAVVFPYEAGLELMAYGYGQMSMKDYIRFSLMRSGVLFVGRFLFVIPWFYLIGIY